MPEKPIKILHLLVQMPVGGAEHMVAALIRGLDREKFQVQAACLGAPGDVGEELARTGHLAAALGLDLKHTSPVRLVRRVRGLLRDLQPDILHTHLYHPNLYGRLAALGLGLKGTVATVHNIYSRVKLHRCLLNCLLGRVSDYVMVFSPPVRDDVRRYDRVPAARIRMVSPGVRLEDLAGAPTREEARARLGVTGFCLGTVSRLEEQKGHAYLLEAVAGLRREIGELTVLLVGDGSERAALERRSAALGLTGCVRFLGTRRDVPLILRALDVFVQPSRWEGIPLTLLEAMGAGLPVVSTRVGRAPEVIADGENGRLVPVGDRDALAAAVWELYESPEKRRLWGDRARRTIEEKYTLEHFMRQFDDLYLELYEKGRRS